MSAEAGNNKISRAMNYLRTSRGYSQGSSEALAVVMELQAERDDLQLIIDGYDRTPAEARAAVAEAQRDEARAALAAQTAAIEVLATRWGNFGTGQPMRDMEEAVDECARQLRAVIKAAK